MTKDWVHGVGHSPVCQILLQIVVKAVITSSPPAWTSFAGMLSTKLTSLSSMIVLPPPPLREGRRGRLSVSVWGQFSTDGSQSALSLYSSEQYPVHRFSLSRSSVRHFLEQSWIIKAFFSQWSRLSRVTHTHTHTHTYTHTCACAHTHNTTHRGKVGTDHGFCLIKESHRLRGGNRKESRYTELLRYNTVYRRNHVIEKLEFAYHK